MSNLHRVTLTVQKGEVLRLALQRLAGRWVCTTRAAVNSTQHFRHQKGTSTPGNNELQEGIRNVGQVRCVCVGGGCNFVFTLVMIYHPHKLVKKRLNLLPTPHLPHFADTLTIKKDMHPPQSSPIPLC